MNVINYKDYKMIIIGCSGIGKTTIANKNNIFLDAEILDKKLNTEIINNKIILFNYKKQPEYIKLEDAYFIDINKIYYILLKRIKKREIKKLYKNKTIKEIYKEIDNYIFSILDYLDYLDYLNRNNYNSKKIIKINNEEELNNLENILLNIFYKIKKDNK